jgi:polyisoprenoid-binding protein YceI
MLSGFKSTRAASLGFAAAAALFAAALSLSAQMPGGGMGGPGGPGGPGGGGQPPTPPPAAGAHLDIIAGSSAAYKVTEQFVGIDFPNDAIGTSTGVSGTIIINKDGSIDPSSKLTVDLTKLSSDQDMRDNFARTRVLETATYPNAVFVPTKVEGIPVLIPFNGQSGVTLTGNLTIHGVTKPTVFKGIVTFNRDNTLAGIAKTTFTWSTFSLTPPKIGRLANVSDNVELTIVFRFKRS